MADKNFSCILSTKKDRLSGLFFLPCAYGIKSRVKLLQHFSAVGLVFNSECGRDPTAAPSVKRTEIRRSGPVSPDPRYSRRAAPPPSAIQPPRYSRRGSRFLLRGPWLSGHNLTARNLKKRPKIRATVPVLNSYKGHVSHKYLLII